MGHDSWRPCMKKYWGNPNIYLVDFNAKTKNMELLEKYSMYYLHFIKTLLSNTKLQCTPFSQLDLHFYEVSFELSPQRYFICNCDSS